MSALRSTTFLLVLIADVPGATALLCQQCNGWDGQYPLRYTTASTCDTRNNECYTAQFCVKIIDAMSPGTNYATFKGDCYFSNQLQINPTNLTTIENRVCYPYQDGSSPVKRYYYCFCNDRDYCNSTSQISVLLSLLLVLLIQH